MSSETNDILSVIGLVLGFILIWPAFRGFHALGKIGSPAWILNRIREELRAETSARKVVSASRRALMALPCFGQEILQERRAALRRIYAFDLSMTDDPAQALMLVENWGRDSSGDPEGVAEAQRAKELWEKRALGRGGRWNPAEIYGRGPETPATSDPGSENNPYEPGLWGDEY